LHVGLRFVQRIKTIRRGDTDYRVRWLGYLFEEIHSTMEVHYTVQSMATSIVLSIKKTFIVTND
jgi:hypothetical protein